MNVLRMEQRGEEDVARELEQKMLRATGAVIDVQRALNRNLPRGFPGSGGTGRPRCGSDDSAIGLRTVACVLAFDRIAQTASEGGIWP